MSHFVLFILNGLEVLKTPTIHWVGYIMKNPLKVQNTQILIKKYIFKQFTRF